MVDLYGSLLTTLTLVAIWETVFVQWFCGPPADFNERRNRIKPPNHARSMVEVEVRKIHDFRYSNIRNRTLRAEVV
jgi:hypothetical protein